MNRIRNRIHRRIGPIINWSIYRRILLGIWALKIRDNPTLCRTSRRIATLISNDLQNNHNVVPTIDQVRSQMTVIKERTPDALDEQLAALDVQPMINPPVQDQSMANIQGIDFNRAYNYLLEFLDTNEKAALALYRQSLLNEGLEEEYQYIVNRLDSPSPARFCSDSAKRSKSVEKSTTKKSYEFSSDYDSDNEPTQKKATVETPKEKSKSVGAPKKSYGITRGDAVDFIVGVKKDEHGDELEALVKYKNGNDEFVSTSIVAELAPKDLIQYYELRLRFLQA